MVSMRSMRSFRYLPILLLAATPALTQTAPTTYGIGRAPTAAELAASSITIQPDGKGLPKGSGTAAVGAKVFVDAGCEGCHGVKGAGGVTSAPALFAAKGPTEANPWDRGVMAVKAPYATLVWSFINRAMPFGNEGSLKPDEVFSLTAYLLAINQVIPQDMVVDQDNLGKVKMPMNREPSKEAGPTNWVQVPDWQPNSPRLKGYPG
jgi:S-disulfanyl-L-cysteine oxidoreductase SoxD